MKIQLQFDFFIFVRLIIIEITFLLVVY